MCLNVHSDIMDLRKIKASIVLEILFLVFYFIFVFKKWQQILLSKMRNILEPRWSYVMHTLDMSEIPNKMVNFIQKIPLGRKPGYYGKDETEK